MSLDKQIHIIGINGNMGRRYAAILKYLGVKVTGHDKGLLSQQNTKDMYAADGFIIATPTDTHLDEIRNCFSFEKPILCEKPLTTNLALLDDFEEAFRPEISLLSVVNQYKYLDRPTAKGATYFNYWNSGKDGLAWDCVSLFAVARGIVRLNNTSPYWVAQLNGRKLSLVNMDFAYIEMIEDWLEKPESNYAQSRKAHEKAAEYLILNRKFND